MKINKLILKNGFTYQELLKLKKQYKNKKDETYGKGVKVTDDESLKKYILLIAELCGGNILLVFPVFFVMMLGAYFYNDGAKEVLVYLILFILFVSFYAFKSSRGINLNFLLTAKLVKLRFLMFFYRVSPPKVN